MQILIEEHLVVRLARPENVKAGDWAYVVTCKGCGDPLVLLRDPSGGTVAKPLIGDGRISAACYSCFHEGIYQPDEAYPLQMAKDIEFRTSVPKASGKTRQPLRSKYRNARATFGAAWLEDRPEAAAAIGRCVALWTEVESQMANLLTTLLGAQAKPVLSVFLTLRSGRGQGEALNAAAEATLSEPDLLLFRAIMLASASVEKERNSLVHGRYGGTYEVKEGILWIAPEDLIQHSLRVRDQEPTEENLEWLRDRTFIYEPADIQTIADSITDIDHILGLFIGLLHPSWQPRPHEREKQYQKLCSEPRIAPVLCQLREGQKKNPQGQRVRSRRERKRKL